MGSCVSVSKGSDSALRFRLGTGSPKDEKLFASPSPTDVEKQKKGDGLEFDEGKQTVVSQLNFNCSSFGSKDEAFFDSKPWLDSDNEDDFFSVRGDLTPYGASSPNNQIITSRLIFPSTTPDEPSPRKKLAQLLLEVHQSEEEEHRRDRSQDLNSDEKKSEESADDSSKTPKSVDATPNRSGSNSICNSGIVPEGGLKNGKERPSKTLHCCLPSVVPNFQFHEKKKKDKQRSSSPDLQNVG